MKNNKNFYKNRIKGFYLKPGKHKRVNNINENEDEEDSDPQDVDEEKEADSPDVEGP